MTLPSGSGGGVPDASVRLPDRPPSSAGLSELQMRRIRNTISLGARWSKAVSKVTEPRTTGIGEVEVQQEQAAPPSIASAELLQGHRELLIHHAGQTYRLRLTATNKLILMK